LDLEDADPPASRGQDGSAEPDLLPNILDQLQTWQERAQAREMLATLSPCERQVHALIERRKATHRIGGSGVRTVVRKVAIQAVES